MVQRTFRRRWTAALVAAAVAGATLVVVGDPAGAAGSVTVARAGTGSVPEGTAETFTVTRTDPANAENITYSVTGEAAATTEGDGSVNGTLSFAAGEASQTVAITPTDDNDIETGETFSLSLTGTDDGSALPGATVVGIADNGEEEVSFQSAAQVPATEDDSAGGNTVQVDVVRGGTGVSTQVTVSSSSTGDATVGNLTIPAGETTGQVTVTIVGDDVAEAVEDITLTITNVSGVATIGSPSSKVLRITDDDAAPVANDDPFAALEDGPAINGNVLTNDTDADSAGLTVASNTEPANGTLVLVAATGAFSYTPALDFSGVDSFTYTATDGTNTSNTATVTINVTDVNDPPVANDDAYTMNEDAVLTRNAGTGVRANDTDLEDAVSALAVTLLTNVTNGALALSADGSFIYTPRENFSGVDQFTYTLTDFGGLTDTATVIITIEDFNANPVANNDTFLNVARNQTTAISGLLDNDDDQDNDPLSISTVSSTGSAGGTVDCSVLPNVCQYTPATGFAGTETFTYTAADGNGGSDTATVTLHVGYDGICDQTGRNLVGTGSDDVLCGTNQSDTIVGGGGNDIILGGGGNDTLTGGTGNDIIFGGGGNDTIVEDATAGNDTLVVSEGDVGSDSIGSIEKVILNALGGGDLVTVIPSANTEFQLNGNSGFDRLVYQETGLTNINDNGSRITANGVEDVTYTSFETVQTDGLLFLGTSGVDDFDFINAPAGGLRIDLLGGDDSIGIDFGSLDGDVEISDSGNSGTDQLTVSGSSGPDVIDAVRGEVKRFDERVIFQDMERLVLNGGGGDDVIRLDMSLGAVIPAAIALPEFVLMVGGTGTDLLELTYDRDCTIDRGASPVTITLDDGAVVALDSTLEGADVMCDGVRSVVASASGYWMARSNGVINAFGEVQGYGSAPDTPSDIAALVNHPANVGVWAVEDDGTIYAFGRALHMGDADEFALNGPIVSMASSRTGDGYYLLGSDGGVFSYGDAKFHGSTGNIALNRPVVSMAANPSAEGYWFVATDGGVFAFGPNAGFFGSVPGVLPPGVGLQEPIVGMAPTATGLGYWLVAADGGVFAFGDAAFHGSVPGALGLGVKPNQPIVGIVATATGNGYWIVARDGGVFAFGDAVFHGSLGSAGIADLVAFAG